ncbi:MAG: tetratricopeptide repeat protein [bacterium]
MDRSAYRVSFASVVCWFLIFLFMSIGCHRAATGSSLQFGDYLFEQQEYDRAITEYYREFFISPSTNKNGFIDLRLGIACAANEDVDKARFFLTQVIEQHPHTEEAGWALFSLAKLYHQKQHYDLSLQHLGKLFALETNKVFEEEAEIITGWNYLKLNAWNSAADWYELHKGNPDISAKIREGNRLRLKSPFIGGLASALIPGAGHFYAGMWQDGIVSLLLNAAFGYAAYEAFQENNSTAGWILTFFELSWYSGNIYTGIGSVHKANKKTIHEFLHGLIKHGLPQPSLTYELPE